MREYNFERGLIFGSEQKRRLVVAVVNDAIVIKQPTPRPTTTPTPTRKRKTQKMHIIKEEENDKRGSIIGRLAAKHVANHLVACHLLKMSWAVPLDSRQLAGQSLPDANFEILFW